MRFRIIHLLLTCIVVALFAIAFSHPNELWLAGTAFGLWLIYAVMGVRAVARPNERAILVCALIFGVSYYWLSLSAWSIPPGIILQKLWYAIRGNPYPGDGHSFNFYMRIGHNAFSLFFALLGGALGAYWLRSQTK